MVTTLPTRSLSTAGNPTAPPQTEAVKPNRTAAASASSAIPLLGVPKPSAWDYFVYRPERDAEPDSAAAATAGCDSDDDWGPPIVFSAKQHPVDLNQYSVASRFAKENEILRDGGQNRFYAYDQATGLWGYVSDDHMSIEIGHTIHHILDQYEAENLLPKRTERSVAQIRRIVGGLVEQSQPFVTNRTLIHVANGMIDLGQDPPVLLPFAPEYHSRNRAEISFDPQATCPRFTDELLRSALDDDDVALLQRYAGQCLLGRNVLQRILLLRGTSGGGKSTLANVIEEIIGTANMTQLRVRQLSERFELAAYDGKTLLSGKDVPSDFLNHRSAHVLKALVGGDRLTAEQKNAKERFGLVGQFNVIVTANTRLHVRLDGDTAAWRRRLLIIDYDRPPVSRPIPEFAKLLVESEGPGILNFFIEGARRLLCELNETGTLALTAAQIERVDALLHESDSVRHYVVEAVESRPGDVTVSELVAGYARFCQEQGWRPVTPRQFENQVSDIIMEHFHQVKRTDIMRFDTNRRGFANIGLR